MTRRTPKRSRTTLCIAAVLIAAAGCSHDSGPRVEAWKDGAYQPLAVSAYTIEGTRDGATTQAVATFTLASGVRVRVEFDVVYNPTPALGEGRWSVEGENASAGTVRAESVRFLGGQGEGPSLGGRFLLEDNGTSRFRVVLPLSPVGQSGWTPQ